MKSTKRWFLGLALVLPVALLLVMLSSLQPASADVDIAMPHRFYGTVTISTTGELVQDGTWVQAIAEEAVFPDGGTVELGAENPVSTTNGEYDMLVQGEELSEYDRIAFYIYYEEGGGYERADCREPGETEWQSPCSIRWHSNWETELELQAKEPWSVGYTLTVTAGDCCTVTVDGVPITPTFTVSFPDIGSAVLEAITGTCCNFVQWTVDGTDVITANPTTIVLTEDLAVEAICYVPTFTLTTHVDPLGSGQVLQDPAPPHLCGTAVTVTAVPTSAWRFVEWSGALTGTVDHGTIEMYSNEVVTAHFAEATHPLTVTSDGCRPISVTGAVVDVVAAGGSATYVISYGLTVTLDVLDAECCVFDGWQVDGAPVAGDPIVVLVDDDHTAVAVSHGPPFTLTVLKAGRGDGTVTGSGTYTPCHTVVTITAEPDEHSVFVDWSGDWDAWTSTNPTDTVDMDMDKTVTATFNLVTYTVTISDSVPPEGGDVEIEEEWPDPEGEYEYGETITVTAVPSYCYEFVGWGGDWDGITDTQVIITVTGDLEIFAIFQLQIHTLDIVVDPLGKGQVTVDPDLSVYTCCTYITLTAVPTDNWQFVGWSGGATGTATETVIHMGEEDLVVTATFALETFTLTYDPDPEGGTVGVEEEDPDGEYEYGETITITADEAYCYEFVGWTGDLEGYPNPAVITVTKDLAFEATFQRQEHSLTVNVAPPGGGSVTLDPPGGSYTCCTTVNLTAVPTNENWEFVEWSGAASGTLTQTSVHIGEEDLVVTATFYFSPTGYILTVNTVGDGSVTKNPDQAAYDPGDVVTLTAVADPGWTFSEWSGDLTGSDNPDTVTMTSDKEVTATFTTGPDEYVLTVTSDGCCSISVEYDTTVETVAAGDTEQYNILDGVVVTLTATPADLCGFDGWQVDGGPVTGNPITVTMDDDYTAVATCTRHFIFLPVVARNYSP